MMKKIMASAYTEAEFVNWLKSVKTSTDAENKKDVLVLRFEKPNEFLAGLNLIFYPQEEPDISAEDIIETVKRYYAFFGLPSFKTTE